MPRNGGVKAAGQAGARGGQAFQIRAADPQNDALIRIGIGGDARLMQLQRADEHPVAGAHTVDLVFHDIFHPTAQQQIDFVKIVVVQLDLVHIRRAVAVDLVVRRDHRLPGGIGVEVGG